MANRETREPMGTAEDLGSLADSTPVLEPELLAKPLAAILGELEAYYRKYVVFPTEHQRTAVVLWSAHTHVFRQFMTTPRLHLSSAEKQSGKTLVLDLAEHIVAGAWRMLEPSEATIYRKVQASHPTLLIDEVDAIFSPNAQREGLRAILNAGYRSGAKVPRCVGEGRNQEVQDFDVYAPVALAGIGPRWTPEKRPYVDVRKAAIASARDRMGSIAPRCPSASPSTFVSASSWART